MGVGIINLKQSKNLKIKPKDDEERLFLDFNVHIFSHIIYLLYPKYDADVSRMCIQLCVLHCVTLSPADDAECQVSLSVNQMPMSCQRGYSTKLTLCSIIILLLCESVLNFPD